MKRVLIIATLTMLIVALTGAASAVSAQPNPSGNLILTMFVTQTSLKVNEPFGASAWFRAHIDGQSVDLRGKRIHLEASTDGSHWSPFTADRTTDSSGAAIFSDVWFPNSGTYYLRAHFNGDADLPIVVVSETVKMVVSW